MAGDFLEIVERDIVSGGALDDKGLLCGIRKERLEKESREKPDDHSCDNHLDDGKTSLASTRIHKAIANCINRP